MIDIVKLANGNVAIYDSTSGDFINSLSPDIVEIECNVNGSVKVVQDNGSVEYIDPTNVANTEVVPAAAIPFSGTCADLAALLSSDFFFVVSGGGGGSLATLSDVSLSSPIYGDYLEYNGTVWVNQGLVYTIELIDALTVDFYAPYDMKINSVTDILNTPTTTIQDDNVAYVLGATIATGSKITVTVNTASVVNLNIEKA